MKQIRVNTDGVWAWTAKNETRKKGKARWRSIRATPTRRIVAQIRA
ncbi:hypothetical protein ACFXI8_23630 [Streptomyces niveus]